MTGFTRDEQASFAAGARALAEQATGLAAALTAGEDQEALMRAVLTSLATRFLNHMAAAYDRCADPRRPGTATPPPLHERASS